MRLQIGYRCSRSSALHYRARTNLNAAFVTPPTRLFLGLLLVILLLSPTFAKAQGDPLNPVYMPAIDQNVLHYPSNIWITGPLAKVRQDVGSPGNVHWAIVSGTQNEFQGFQVHVQAPAAGIANLSVTMSDLVNSRTGTRILASSTNIVVYREAYMNVTQKTATAATFYNSTGYYPDILIPAIDPYYHQTTNAFPINIAANQNQSVWIDVHIPASAPSGYYSGQATVKSGATVLATLPVVYAVWQWPASQGGEMPSTASLRNTWGKLVYGGLCIQAYGSTGACSPYPGGQTGTDVDGMVMMLDHRLSIGQSDTDTIYPGAGSWTTWDANYACMLNGTACHVAGILSGAKLTTWSIGCSGDCSVLAAGGNFPTSTFANFASHFNSNGWFPKLFYYLCDEPPPGMGNCGQFPPVNPWQVLKANATSDHNASTPIIPTLVTTDLSTATSNGGLNSIDWMVPLINNMDPQGGSLQRSTYNNWLGGSPTRILASYLSCSSAGTCSNGTVGNLTYPNYDVDAVPVANRVMEWMTFSHGLAMELYYGVDSQFCSGCNPWNSLYTYGNNGDGDLVYPCSASQCGIQIPIWLPSLRLKMARDGMQDYEYLKVLTNNLKSTLVQSEIACWITNSYTFNVNPTAAAGAFTCDLTEARQALGNALHGLTYSVALLPPTGLSAVVQ
jgi:hypothetical protein